MWTKGKTTNDAVVIGFEGWLYKLKGHVDSSLMTSTIIPCDLWYKILAHVHYKELPIVSKVVTGLPYVQINYEGVCKVLAQGKNNKNPYPNSDIKAKGNLDIIHLDVWRPMQTNSLSEYDYYGSFIDD